MIVAAFLSLLLGLFLGCRFKAAVLVPASTIVALPRLIEMCGTYGWSLEPSLLGAASCVLTLHCAYGFAVLVFGSSARRGIDGVSLDGWLRAGSAMDYKTLD